MVRYLRPLAACLALTVALLPGCAASRKRKLRREGALREKELTAGL
jgi:hypothetical protein